MVGWLVVVEWEWLDGSGWLVAAAWLLGSGWLVGRLVGRDWLVMVGW